jgi:hypothetical protein
MKYLHSLLFFSYLSYVFFLKYQISMHFKCVVMFTLNVWLFGPSYNEYIDILIALQSALLIVQYHVMFLRMTWWNGQLSSFVFV